MPKTQNRFLSIFALTVLVLGLAGCTTKLAYNYLDWAMMWKVERLVSLDAEQKQQTKQALQEFHAWHRKTQLVQYAQYLSQLEKRIGQGPPITAKEVHAETDKIQLLLDQSLTRMLPDISRVLRTLSDQQVSELLDSLTEEREEYVEEHIDISEKKRLKKRQKDLEKHLTRWLGKLTRQQKQRLNTWSEIIEPYEQLSAKQQILLQTQIAEVLAQRANEDALQSGLKEMMFYRTDNWDPELAAVLGRNQVRTYQLIAAILNSRTEKQHAKLGTELSKYIAICLELASLESVPQNSAERPPVPDVGN